MSARWCERHAGRALMGGGDDHRRGRRRGERADVHALFVDSYRDGFHAGAADRRDVAIVSRVLDGDVPDPPTSEETENEVDPL